MNHTNPADEYIVSASELADAARLDGVPEEIIDVLFMVTATIDDDPAAPPASDSPPLARGGDGGEVNSDDDWAIFQRRSMQPRYELFDLVHPIDRPDQRRQQLAEWQAHLNDGWETIDITTSYENGQRIRIIILQRLCPPIPAPPTPHTTSAAAEMPYTLDPSEYPPVQPPLVMRHPDAVTITVHSPLNVSTNPVLARILADHPIAAHLHAHGKEDTLDIMNQKTAEAYAAAYDQRLAAHPSRPLTPVPTLTANL